MVSTNSTFQTNLLSRSEGLLGKGGIGAGNLYKILESQGEMIKKNQLLMKSVLNELKLIRKQNEGKGLKAVSFFCVIGIRRM